MAPGVATGASAVADRARQLIAEQLFPSDDEKLLICTRVFDDDRSRTQAATADAGAPGTMVTATSVPSPTAPGGVVSSSSRMALSKSGAVPAAANDTRKERFLCITVKRSGKIRLHKVKQTSMFAYQIGRSWALEEVKCIEDVETRQFIVVVNKPYVWFTDQSKTRAEFLCTLVRLCKRYLKKQPKYINISEDLLQAQANILSRDEDKAFRDAGNAEDDPEALAASEAFLNEALMQYQQEKEEVNFDEVLTDYNWQVGGEAAALENRLVDELSALDAATIHAIIQAGDQSATVVALIEKAVKELDTIDEWLTLYSVELNNMGQDIRHIESQNKGLQLQSANQKQLLKELESIFTTLALGNDVLDVLRSCDLESLYGINQCVDAATKLHAALKTKVDPEVSHIHAVVDRMSYFGKEAAAFGDRLVAFLSDLMKLQLEFSERDDAGTAGTSASWKVQGNENLQEQLLQYRKLLGWLKDVEPRKHAEFMLTYAQCAQRIYNKELSGFFERLVLNHAKHCAPEELGYIFYIPSTTAKVLLAAASTASLLTSPTSSSSALASGPTARTASSALTAATKTHRKTPSSDDRFATLRRRGMSASGVGESATVSLLSASDAFNQLLATIVQALIREQNFIVDLFHFAGAKPDDATPISILAELNDKRYPIKDLKAAKRVEELLALIFDGLFADMAAYVDFSVKNDQTATLAFLGALEKRARESQTSDLPFLSGILDTLRERLVQAFDKFVDDQLRYIDDTKVSAKKRDGVLTFMRVFPRFVKHMEGFQLEATSRARKKLDSTYERLVKSMFDALDLIAATSAADDKEQLNAHVLMMENMHHFFTELRAQKIPILDAHTKSAKAQYEHHLSSYVKAMVRRPLGKLLEFFEGIDELLKTNSAEEVGFRLHYNKAAVKKIVEQFPGKEIKKSLEVLYRRVNKHFTEEEGLLQVVWHGIQEEFIRMHGHFEKLIQKCYREAEIRLAFTIDDLCTFFSDIARMH